MKKQLSLASLFLFIILFTNCGTNKSESQDIKNCLAGNWCYPSCSNPHSAWEFSADGTFDFTVDMGSYDWSAWGEWKDIGNNKVEIIYTKTSTGDEQPSQIVSMPDCRTLKVGSTLYKRDDINSLNTNQSTYDIVTFLDGETMNREAFLNDCVKSFKAQGKTSGFKNNGRDFCNCILEELATNFSLYEFGIEAKSVKENTNNNAEAVSLLLNNKKAEKVVYECMQRPELFNNEHMKISSEEELRVIIAECKNNHKNGMTSTEYNELIEYVYIDSYCECYMKRLFATFTIQQLNNMINDSKLTEEAQRIQESCMTDNVRGN